MVEFVVGLGGLLLVLAPIIVVVWILSILVRMERDLARIAEGVHYLAERASRQDQPEP